MGGCGCVRSVPDTPTQEEWLASVLPAHSRVGIDAYLVPYGVCVGVCVGVCPQGVSRSGMKGEGEVAHSRVGIDAYLVPYGVCVCVCGHRGVCSL